MSYNVDLTIFTGKRDTCIGEGFNITYNVAPMFRATLDTNEGLRALDGKQAGDAAIMLSDALGQMKRSKDEMEALNPPNGWGSYRRTLDFMRQLRRKCRNHPLTTVRVM